MGLASTLSWIEAVWIILCTAGAVGMLHGLLHWRKEDRTRARQGINGRVRIYHRGKIRLYSLALTKASLYCLLGIQSALLPPRGDTLRTPFQVHLARIAPVSGALFIIINLLLLIVMIVGEETDRMRMLAEDAKYH